MPAPASESPAKAPPRSKLACRTCRAIKVRCIRPEGGICARCSRYGLQCADPPVVKRKGRPPNSSRLFQNENMLEPTEIKSASSSSLPSQQVKDLFPVGYPYQSAHISPSHISPSQISPAHISPTNVAFAPAQSLVDLSNAPPRSPHVSRNQNLNMAEYLDPPEASVFKGPFFSNARRARYGAEEDEGRINEGDDPVSLRALSEVEANSLVELFHERLNPLVAVLDHQLHTMSYLRRTSSVLFTTVLASSSRFFRHDLHPALLSHARTVLDRALQTGSTDIGVIQSLMLMTYWKDPEDTSGWMKVGMAIRLGYSLFWHIPRTDPLPEDDMEARKLLNAERTWFCLFSFDRGQSYVHGLPTTIRLNEHSDPEIWARGHVHLGHSVDMHIAASIQLCKLKDQWGALCEMKASDASYIEVAIETLTSQCDALVDKYFQKDAPPPPCFNREVEHVLLWSILDFVFVMKRYRLELDPSDPLRLDSCLEVISRIADEVDILAANGMLVIMQDSASCMTSSLVVFARKVYRFSTRSQKSYLLTILHRVLLAHASVTDEDSKTAPAYVARFIRRVLSALSVESRAGSPGPAAALVSGAQDVEVDFFAELGLEEFMHVPEYVAQNEADDGRYWANMLLSEVFPQGLQ